MMMVTLRRFAAWAVPLGIAVFHCGPVAAQNYPVKPVRMVVTGAGGGNDMISRLIGQGLAANLGQQFIFDNRPGANAIIPSQIVANAAADGYTLLSHTGVLWLLPFMQDNVPYHPVKSFAPIMLTGTTPNILVVHPAVPAKSVKELIALAKARPGQLNYGAGSAGSTAHLAAELFKQVADVNIVRITYKGSGPTMTALMSGEVQLSFANASAVLPHVKLGRLLALAITTAEPSALAPGLPTVAASGLPGYESEASYALFAPARTPAALVDRLNQEILKVLSRPDMKETLLRAGIAVVASSPEQLLARMQSEMTTIGKVIRDAGIRAD